MIEQAENAWAFKEWAVICEALAQGRQTIILRKGGIHEGRAGFRIAQREFWLLPTKFHASADALMPAAHDLLVPTESLNAGGAFHICHYAVVEEVHQLTSKAQALALAGLHNWSETTVRERFHYKHPGLFCLVVRIFNALESVVIKDTPAIAGCRSWVELPRSLATANLTPALSDEAFEAMASDIKARLS
jgi:hypothetical protein